AGVYIPRFCYHPRMRSVGMCRMCLVEVKGPRGFSLLPACFQPVAEGQEVVTTSEKVRKAQDGVLELLLVNHPLDCPVCDKGGECPLQDQTLTYGPGESRFVEEKRHWAKPIPVSTLVDLDRERCIQCDRCTRFAREVAGDPFITFQGRGDHIEVNTFPDRPFSSYFSGNTVQICPVGALTASHYRFKARPWDLEQAESTCTSCSFGCRVAVQSSAGRLVRYLGVDADAINQGWLCDKGRFDLESVNTPLRRARPLLRSPEAAQEEVSWPRALAAVAGRLAAARERNGPESIAVLGGARLANEDAYAWAKLAKGVLGTDSVDAQMGDGLPAALVQGLPRATVDDACHARAVLLLAPDLREELPLLFLRLREAAVEASVPLVELAATDTAMTAYASVSMRHLPGELASLVARLTGAAPASGSGPGRPAEAPGSGGREPAGEELETARGLLGLGGDAGGAGGPAGPDTAGSGIVVVLGRSSLAERAEPTVHAAALLREALPAARFLPVLRRANVQGALDAGLSPGLLPGRVALPEGAGHYGAAWGGVPAAAGRDAEGILRAAAAGEIEVLVLLGADPLADFPDRRLAQAALSRAGFVVSVETIENRSSPGADAVLPAGGYAERPGTTTSCEGRVTTLAKKVVAPGVAWPDWMIAAELAATLGADLGFTSLEDIWQEMERLSPLHAGVSRSALVGPAERDGVVLPLSRAPGRERAGGPAPLDPMAIPGILSVEMQGSPSFSGAIRLAPGEHAGPEGPAPARPPMLSFPGSGPAPAPGAGPGTGTEPGTGPGSGARTEPGTEPGTGAGEVAGGSSLRLVCGRRLYDRGTLVQSCEALAGLVPASTLRVSPSELERLGLSAGATVAVSSATGRVVLPLEADRGLPPGVAVAGFNLDGEGPSGLIDCSSPVTEIRLEAT
ncbi:MAG: molybdopterin-dependent oxidoreductase, partial [Acidimicrobiales bacterium]